MTDRYGTDDNEADIERVRLGMLAAARDPKTFAVLDRIGVTPGMHVLEVGAGSGSVSAWLAEKVGADGRVMSADIDLQFHEEMPDNVIVRELDIEKDRIPAAHFDIVHARALLQHVPSREEVIPKLIAALKPGGWLVLEDSQIGCRSAAAAGTFAVAVPAGHSHTQDFSVASLVVENLADRRLYEALGLAAT